MALLMTGCASAPPTTQGRAPETATERAAAETVKQPIPACQSGHPQALSNGSIHIKPGETLCVRLKELGSVVVPVAVVDKFDPADTLVVRMWEAPQGNATYLYVHNPLHTYLRYRAYARREQDERLAYTDTCPVMDQRIGVEQWPYAIATLELRDLMAMPKSGTIVCN